MEPLLDGVGLDYKISYSNATNLFPTIFRLREPECEINPWRNS